MIQNYGWNSFLRAEYLVYEANLFREANEFKGLDFNKGKVQLLFIIKNQYYPSP